MGLRSDLQDEITKKEISVAKLARLADIHPDTIYKFLDGKTEMTASNLDKLFALLRATVDHPSVKANVK